jgi:hypothetical protein
VTYESGPRPRARRNDPPGRSCGPETQPRLGMSGCADHDRGRSLIPAASSSTTSAMRAARTSGRRGVASIQRRDAQPWHRDRHELGQRNARSGRPGHVAARAVAELHDRLVTSGVGGWSRRNGNWSFTIATSSGFKVAATRMPTNRPWPGCGSANWSRVGGAPDRGITGARICCPVSLRGDAFCAAEVG